MRGRLLSFLVLIGILFGGVLSPAIAHAHESGAELFGEVLDVHEPTLTAAQDPAEKAHDLPGQPAAHHHCTIAVEVSAPTVLAAPKMREAEHGSTISRVLASYAQKPPTEPPAA